MRIYEDRAAASTDPMTPRKRLSLLPQILLLTDKSFLSPLSFAFQNCLYLPEAFACCSIAATPYWQESDDSKDSTFKGFKIKPLMGKHLAPIGFAASQQFQRPIFLKQFHPTFQRTLKAIFTPRIINPSKPSIRRDCSPASRR